MQILDLPDFCFPKLWNVFIFPNVTNNVNRKRLDKLFMPNIWLVCSCWLRRQKWHCISWTAARTMSKFMQLLKMIKNVCFSTDKKWEDFFTFENVSHRFLLQNNRSFSTGFTQEITIELHHSWPNRNSITQNAQHLSPLRGNFLHKFHQEA